MNLFAYGTLMFPDIWEKVAGQSLKPAAKPALATLDGFAIRRVAGESFPVIFASETESVSGLLYFNISGKVLTLVDRYESEVYRREQVTVALENDNVELAEVYVLRPRFQRLASEEFWTAEWFEQHAKAEYMRQFHS